MTDDFNILLTRYFDGSASAEEAERLERRVASDPAAARAMLDASHQELALRDACSADRAIAASAPSGDSDATRSATPITRPAFTHPSLESDTDSADGDRLSIRPWHRRWQPFAVAASLLLAAGFTWHIARSTDSTPVQRVEGTKPSPNAEPVAMVELSGPGVWVERNGVAKPADAGTSLAGSDRLRTGPSAGATFRYPAEQTRVTLSPSSTLAVASESGGKRLDLSAGVVDCEVEKQLPGRSLTVATAQARVKVVGTQFRVATAGRMTRVEVGHGTVRVTRLADGATVDVSAGEYVDVGADSSTRPAAGPAGWPVAQGRNMTEFWSPKVRPAGINE